MRYWRASMLGAAALFATGAGITQTATNRLEMVKSDRCAPSRLKSEEQVRCFAWATTRKSGDIQGAQARCTNPDYVASARNCLNDHRMKKEFSGVEEKVCAEISYRFIESSSRSGLTIVDTRELPECDLVVAPTPAN